MTSQYNGHEKKKKIQKKIKIKKVEESHISLKLKFILEDEERI